MIPSPPAGWRSLLFVPADNARLLEKAAERSADAVILDLEDAVPPAAKEAARAALPAAAERLAAAGATLLVRVNAGWLPLVADLAAAVRPCVRALVLPKVEDAGRLKAVAEMLDEVEASKGMVPGQTGLLPLIESPAALGRLDELAAAPRVIGLALGSEDFSLQLGAPPSPASLTLPCQLLALAAATHSLMAIGLPGSLAEFRDLDAWRRHAEAARAVGMTGALCIHPAQVAVVNQAFAPDDEQLAWARAVLATWAESEKAGSGVAALDGRMIDKPVVERARALLARVGG